MSVQSVVHKKYVAETVLRRETRYLPPRRMIGETVADLLKEMEQSVGTGEILWNTLSLTVGPDRPSESLEFRALVDVYRNDLVDGLTALALADHERKKRQGER